MFKIVFLTIVFLSVTCSKAQRKDYYADVDYKNYKSQEEFNELLDFEKIDYRKLAAVIFHASNEQRFLQGKSTLKYQEELEITSFYHAKDMVENDYFSHTAKTASRKTPKERALLAGITNPYIAENLASTFAFEYESGKAVYKIAEGKYSYSTTGPILPNRSYLTLAIAVVQQWMDSPSHRASLLEDKAVSMGCAGFFDTKSKFDFPKFKLVQSIQLYKEVIPGSRKDDF